MFRLVLDVVTTSRLDRRVEPNATRLSPTLALATDPASSRNEPKSKPRAQSKSLAQNTAEKGVTHFSRTESVRPIRAFRTIATVFGTINWNDVSASADLRQAVGRKTTSALEEGTLKPGEKIMLNKT